MLLASLLASTTAFAPSSSAATFASGIRDLQDAMISQATAADPTAQWTVDEHGRGRACIVEDGELWEKGCVSVTLIEDGALTATRAAAISARTGSSAIAEGSRYSACALSFVLHAKSPLVPTLRGDVRVFAVEGGDEWYGGGIDLTPSYVVEEDCVDFHDELRAYKRNLHVSVILLQRDRAQGEVAGAGRAASVAC